VKPVTLNKSALYDCFDAEWNSRQLFRELALTDSEEVMEMLYRHRVFQLAFAFVAPPHDSASAARLTQLLNTVSTNQHRARYERLIFISTFVPGELNTYVEWISKHFSDLLSERRVYTSIVNKYPGCAASLFCALGGAQPVYPEANGSWRILDSREL
jgi:hypothetical protein